MGLVTQHQNARKPICAHAALSEGGVRPIQVDDVLQRFHDGAECWLENITRQSSDSLTSINVPWHMDYNTS
jgi:hypothetical protein